MAPSYEKTGGRQAWSLARAQPDTGIHLCSSVPGRKRFLVPAIKRKPRLAAAVEAHLFDTLTVGTVRANHLTGRVLVLWPCVEMEVDAEGLIREALAAGPMSEECFELRRVESSPQQRRLAISVALGSTGLMLAGGKFLSGQLNFSTSLRVVTTATTVVTSVDFFRQLWRVATGQTRPSVGALVGLATISNLLMKESTVSLAVVTYLNLGELLELRAVNRARELTRTVRLNQARLVSDGEEEVFVSVHSLRRGQLLDLRAGETTPVSGVVEGGVAFVAVSATTGKLKASRVTSGDGVASGSKLASGQMTLRVEEPGESELIRLIDRQTDQTRAYRSRHLSCEEQVAAIAVPGAVGSAGLMLLVTRDPQQALNALLLACPYSAALAARTPLRLAVALKAHQGVVVRHYNCVEALAQVDTVCFDKTGTLTHEILAIRSLKVCDLSFSEEEILHLAASVELKSSHPIARTIVGAMGGPEAIEGADAYEGIPGLGVSARKDNHELLVGSRRLMEQRRISGLAEHQSLSERAGGSPGGSPVFVARDGALIGVLFLGATLRPESSEVVAAFRQLGIEVILLSGDDEDQVALTAQDLAIERFFAGADPMDKVRIIGELQAAGQRVLMVGDGANDAPALVTADVGIAIHARQGESACEAADILIASRHLYDLPHLVKFSRAALQVVRQNYGIALGISQLSGLMSLFGWLSESATAAWYNASTCLVALSSGRLLATPVYQRHRHSSSTDKG